MNRLMRVVEFGGLDVAVRDDADGTEERGRVRRVIGVSFAVCYSRRGRLPWAAERAGDRTRRPEGATRPV